MQYYGDFVASVNDLLNLQPSRRNVRIHLQTFFFWKNICVSVLFISDGILPHLIFGLHISLKFGSEAWVLKKGEEQRLEAAQMKF